MRLLLPVLFVLMCLAQWFVPGKMIFDNEFTKNNGAVYKFKTRPIDPTDPFRGKYVTLSFQEDAIVVDSTSTWDFGDVIFVEFTTDEDGFAKPTAAYHEIPPSENYLKTRVNYVSKYDKETKVFYDIPFSRLYMEESKASEAERVYWESLSDTTQVTYALVSIGKGNAVLQNVYINDRTLVDIVREINSTEK